MENHVRELVNITHGYKAIRAQSGVPGLEKVYGVGRGTMFYELADADLPSEHDWSTSKSLNRTPRLFDAVRSAVRSDLHLLHAYTFDDGTLYPGDVAGRGVEIDEALAAKYPYQRACLPVNRLQHDGTLWNW